MTVQQTIRISRQFTPRELARFAETAEKLGGITIQKEDCTFPASNLIGLLSLRLKPGDTVRFIDSGTGTADKIAALLNIISERNESYV